MSKVGKALIKIPDGVKVDVSEGGVCISGRNAKVVKSIPCGLKCVLSGDTLSVMPAQDLKSIERSRAASAIRARWGLFRKILYNSVKGLSEGFVVTLEITGVGYKASVTPDGKMISLVLGYSHELNIPIPEGVSAVCNKNVIVELKGCDNVVLGDFAAKLSSFRVPDPYKLKGIIRKGRFIRKKEGKAG